MKISFDIGDEEELAIISAAATKIVKRRAKLNDEKWGASPTEDIANAIEDASTALRVDANGRAINVRVVDAPGALFPVAVVDAPAESTDTLIVAQSTDTSTSAGIAPADVTAADAVAAVTKATRRGMPMPAIVEYVGRVGKKVPEMAPDERAAFVTWLDAWTPGA